MWVELVGIFTCWWILAPTFACVVVEIFSFFALHNFLAVTSARGCVVILVVMASLVFLAFAAAGLVVIVLSSAACLDISAVAFT